MSTTIIIRTRDLTSYDASILLPIEIHLTPGPIPEALAVYDGEPAERYDSLGELCEAHQIDPDSPSMDDVRTAELGARVPSC